MSASSDPERDWAHCAHTSDPCTTLAEDIIRYSWLRVSGTAKMPQIDQSVRHQLHTVVTLLFELKAQQKPFEFVFPREGPLHTEP